MPASPRDTATHPLHRRVRFVVQGQVQGVGFRPFVFTLAEECGLTGFVRNSPRGVVIEVQGREAALDAFAHALCFRLPPLARITGLEREDIPPVEGEPAFTIAASTAGDSHRVLISPDTALCADCLDDMRNPAGRRFGYPFTNCTNCGPRYTITRSIPYDRDFTSMACFPLCPECRAEYENPRDRRFHAQPNACPICGPQVWFVGKGNNDVEANSCSEWGSAPHPARGVTPLDPAIGGDEAAGPGGEGGCSPLTGDAALRALAAFLAGGGIAAVKGLGGFHLACDATNEAAVALLRQRKHRPHKPFAVMVPDLDTARTLAHVGPEEEALLTSPEHPIVLCRRRACSAGVKAQADTSGTAPAVLAPGVSPDTAAIGLMLPYTPLHRVLFDHYAACCAEDSRNADVPDSEIVGGEAMCARPVALVMTSGNRGGEPICLGNREALAALADMADAWLFHNRDILIRVDDSVVRPLPGGGTLFFRRARGYVPRPVSLPPLDAAVRAGNGDASGSGTAAGEDKDALRITSDSLSDSSPVVLGAGAELKNTLCLTKGNDAFVSQHIGDMANVETAAFHREIGAHLAMLLKVRPEAVVRDLHPDYLSSALAEESGLPVLRLQHHFAHAHAVLAEHRHQGPALVLALDGTGLGEDGALWGGELLYVDTERGPLHARLAHFAPMPLPGGEAAIREPWRIAHALLWKLGLLGARRENAGAASPGGAAQAQKDIAEASYDDFSLPWLPEHAATARLLPTLLARGINTPVSTSCGRLFDAVSALLGLCLVTSYEGQAAIRLEEAQGNEVDETAGEGNWGKHYPCAVFLREEFAARTNTDITQSPKIKSFGEKEMGVWGKSLSQICPPSLRSGWTGPFFKRGFPSSPTFSPPLVLDTHTLFTAVYVDALRGVPVAEIARRFHASLAAGLADMAAEAAAAFGVRVVGLSGGSMQNVTLAEALAENLRAKGLTPLLHRELPPNDGCISLGQAAWGRLVLGKRGD